MEVAVKTLGCRANQADSEKLINSLLQEGYRVVSELDKPDLYILNTCSVTTGAEAKARKLVRRQKRDNPKVQVIFTGCYAELEGTGIREELPEVDRVVPGRKKGELPDIIARDIEKPAGETGELQKSLRTRKFLKIQDGCREHCTYCIVPRVRGELESKRLEEVLEEVKRLVEVENYREIVFTGIHLGHYGKDLGENDYLETLGRRIDSQYSSDRVRFRFSSLEPQDVSEELVDIISSSSVFCPQLHLPLQSGSDKILKRMGRNYSRQQYRGLIEYIHSTAPDIALSTDAMVGFPGETEEDFEQTRELIRELNFFDVHVFRYSERPGTPAAEMDNKIHSRKAVARSKKLRSLASELKEKYFEQFLGRKLKVLVEDNSEERSFGYSSHYFPVKINDTYRPGEFIQISPHKYQNGNLIAPGDSNG
ncbi:MAG: tRNA (N(6)-L-threonylcarbamoyladenosine(37)-C(2))-methylthiotransferase MtaB [bacterium]